MVSVDFCVKFLVYSNFFLQKNSGLDSYSVLHCKNLNQSSSLIHSQGYYQLPCIIKDHWKTIQNYFVLGKKKTLSEVIQNFASYRR